MSFPVIIHLLLEPVVNNLLPWINAKSWHLREETADILRRQHWFLWNDVLGMTAEIPYWWLATIQVWEVLLIGWKFASSNQKHYPDLSSDMSSLWHFCSQMFSDVFWEETIGGQKSAVFSGQYHRRSDCTTLRCWNRSLYVSGVSGKLPTYPSAKPTLTLTSHLGQNVNDNVPLELLVFLFKG